MSGFPFEHWLVLLIALATTVLWLLSIYYAAYKGGKTGKARSQ